VLSRKVIEIGTGRDSCERGQIISPVDLPDVPVMPQTLLLMDLGAQEKPVDLKEMTQVVLSDPGATIQILRLVGRERVFGEERPARIEDCISALGMQACVEAVSRRTVSRGKDKPAIMEAWSHAKQVAESCKLIAEESAGSFGPTEAYLTGLLHELGSLPAILGWEPLLAASSGPEVAGLKLAEGWFLPHCIVDYFSEPGNLKAGDGWAEIVQRAHEMSESFSGESPIDDKRESQITARGQQ
jgi:hypothetical protein